MEKILAILLLCVTLFGCGEGCRIDPRSDLVCVKAHDVLVPGYGLNSTRVCDEYRNKGGL